MKKRLWYIFICNVIPSFDGSLFRGIHFIHVVQIKIWQYLLQHFSPLKYGTVDLRTKNRSRHKVKLVRKNFLLLHKDLPLFEVVFSDAISCRLNTAECARDDAHVRERSLTGLRLLVGWLGVHDVLSGLVVLLELFGSGACCSHLNQQKKKL